MTPDSESPCPCGSGRSYGACCGPVIDGAPAPTAEALMRSRYTAFATDALQHMHTTLAPEAEDDYDPEAAERWARQASWLGLTIHDTQAGGDDDREGTVTFTAHYRIGGERHAHTEVARFRRGGDDDRWLYVDGHAPRPETRTTGPKVGRNDPCPCGSGRKYKKCCGTRT